VSRSSDAFSTLHNVRQRNIVYASTLRDVRQRNIAYASTLHNVRQRNIVYASTLRDVRQRNIAQKLQIHFWGFFGVKERFYMIERGLYYASEEYGKLVKDLGGEFNDTKHRPIVCLVKSSESDDLYWAIPMGKLNHRTEEQQERLERFMNYPDDDIRSCYYHIGRTTSRSIFFISDAFPITGKYIDSIHTGGDGEHFVIRNPNLIGELERKLFRILSVENANKDYFRQHITTIKNYLLEEIETDKKAVDAKSHEKV